MIRIKKSDGTELVIYTRDERNEARRFLEAAKPLIRAAVEKIAKQQELLAERYAPKAVQYNGCWYDSKGAAKRARQADKEFAAKHAGK